MNARKHVLVVGSGIAGLIAAIELSREHAVTLVTKAALAESNTRWAQGGIAAAMFSDDSIASHITDTLRAGAGLCDPDAVAALCSEGPDRIRDLIHLGVAFDHAADGELARGLEAAHSYPRVLHAGGDATGLTIETALVRAQPSISVLEHTFALDLILSARGPNSARGSNEAGSVTGLSIIDSSGAPGTIQADAVILASGGAGQLYLHTTNPSVATGDGVAMALRAGAQLADTEFYQFHPTALATPTSPAASTFLISEAVRGEGAILLDAHGRRFMQHIHPSAELAPRDIVARGIALQMTAQNGIPVLLDITSKSTEFLATRFPSIDAATRAQGLDWSRNPIPVTPAAHYWMGGVRTDLYGRTSIPGLYAVGEVACTGVHGANRLASNSLLESLTFAWRCAHLLLNSTPDWSCHPSPQAEDLLLSNLGMDISSPPLAMQTSGDPRFEGTKLQPRYFTPFEETTLDPRAHTTQPFTRLDLQTLMWTHVGIERNATDLKAAAAQLNRWHAEDATIHDRETANLLDLARVIVSAALAREESRGAHFRNDFPESSAAFQHSLVYIQPGCPRSGPSNPGLQDAQTPTTKQAVPC